MGKNVTKMALLCLLAAFAFTGCAKGDAGRGDEQCGSRNPSHDG